MSIATVRPNRLDRTSPLKRSALVLAAIVAAAGIRAEAATVEMGAAAGFAVLGGSTVTSTGLTTIVGNLGVSPGTAVTGFGPGTVAGGTIHANNAAAIQAHADATTAYDFLAGLPFTQDLTGTDLGGLTLTPGVYHFNSSAQLTGTLTLDGQGQTDPLFVFQIGSTLTTASLSSVLLTNGADAGDAYFQIGTSATLATGTSFAGTLIAAASDTLATGAAVDGRVIALGGAVTLDANAVSLPITVVPAPSAAIAGPVLLLGLVLSRPRQRAAR